ncbi:family 20 glycosylhydrolase [Paenibacillus terrigena]|uniref:family 20 glycosylhydrolase n=1 Tax=Paenibacillus terrigena TaxID=369333 RepID=UPI000365BE0B|nr:family 20 glycosylhydrolase [Paenibacillus terrigena]
MVKQCCGAEGAGFALTFKYDEGGDTRIVKKFKTFTTILCLLGMILTLVPLSKADAAEGSVNLKPTVIPSLQEWTGGTGSFTLTENSRLVLPTSYARKLGATAVVFQSDLKELTGRKYVSAVSNLPKAGDIVLTMTNERDESIGDEGYYFEVGDYVTIRANTDTGVFYGTRTALQILAQDGAHIQIPKGNAKDFPKYKVRGFMLDVGRKYFPMDFLKEYVKFMSYYKMNDFQIHLNDNEIFKDNSRTHWDKYEAFRLESTKYPNLTAKDGHYTKKEFRELQDLANLHGMTITPELESPSHALSLTKIRPDLVKDTLPVDHLDITRPEAVEFIKDVWGEYIDGGWFDAKELHFGGDEFDRNDKSTVEAYRQFLNSMDDYFKSKGKTSRMWGSLSFFPGTTPVNKDITINIWNNGWHNPNDAIRDGFNIINTVDGNLYIVPKAGYYYDYLNTKWIYESWDPTYFSGSIKLSENEPKLQGAMFAVWNDLLGKKVSVEDVNDRVKEALPALAQKMWGGKTTDSTYEQFQQISKSIGDVPGTNLQHRVASQSEMVLSYPFEEGNGQTVHDTSGNGYDGLMQEGTWAESGKNGKAVQFNDASGFITTGLPDKGFPWTVSAWVNLDEAATNAASEVTFMQSDYGKIQLKQTGTGKIGFSREGYDYSFNAVIPTGKWVHVALRGDLSGTSLFLDGVLKDTLKDTTLLPIATIGGSHGFVGALDDLQVVNRVLSAKEIAAAAGSPPWTINIAAHQPATASSSEVDYLTPNLAFDEIESSTSRWASKYTDNEWIRVDLGERKAFDKVVLKWEAAYAKGYKIQVSDDDQNWNDVYTTTAGAGGTEIIRFPETTARYVKMLGTKRVGTYGYSLYEFEVYQPNPNDPVTVPEAIRYTENFEDNAIEGWEHVIGKGVGTMALVDDPTGASKFALRLASNGTNNIFVDQHSPAVKDGEVEFKVLPESDNMRLGIIFRYDSNDSWASVGFDKTSWYWVNAQDSYGLMTSDPAAKLTKGVPATVKVKFEGNSVALIVNGVTYYDNVISGIPNTAGKMGARVFGTTTAVFDDFHYNNNVPVTNINVTGVSLDKATITLKEGETADLTATVLPANATNKQVTWSSSDNTIATVAATGAGQAKVTAVKEGTVDIKVTTTDGKFEAISKVTIVKSVNKELSTALIGASSVVSGQSFDVTLGLRNVTQSVYAQDISLQFDPTVLEYVDASSLINGVSVIKSVYKPDGTLRFILASIDPEQALTGNPDMLKITFKSKELTQGTNTTLAVTNAVVSDDGGIEMTAKVSSLAIQVTVNEPGIPGDLNGDGKISIGDLAIIAANYGKTDKDSDWNTAKRADVNHDGKVDLDDLVWVAQRIMGTNKN